MNFEVEYNPKNNKENISKKYEKTVKRKKKKSSNKRKKLILVSTILFIFLATSIPMYFYLNSNTQTPVVKIPEEKTKKLTIFDENSNERPIAIMIDNNVGNNNHIGLQESYLNYEIIVEGGLTRIMAIFKDKNVSTIGPVRSSRHYFLDYALENDAIYTHYGWSTYAENDIQQLNVNNINGLTDDTPYWRDKLIKAPHNVFTSTENLRSYALTKNYQKTSSKWQLLKYDADEISLKHYQEKKQSSESNTTETNLLTANNISMQYSNHQTRSYKYDAENKYYLRFMNEEAHIDKLTNKQLHYKNIIIERVNNKTLDSYGRQDLDTVGYGTGYIITDGYALPINWTKTSRSAKTKYTYKNGKEVVLNDGNTFIQIVPTTSNITIG